MTIQDALTHRSCDNLRMDADKQMCGLDPDSPFVELAVEVFGLLADATRVRIILALRGSGEVSVNHLADIVDKSPAAVSQHLAKLRMARIDCAKAWWSYKRVLVSWVVALMSWLTASGKQWIKLLALVRYKGSY